MSFVEIPPKRHGRTIGNPVRVSVTTKHLRIHIDRRLAKDLKWAGGTTLRVDRGEGEDAGKIRLSPAPTGYTLQMPSADHHALLVTVPAWGGLPGRRGSQPAEFSPVCKDGNGQWLVEITLPWSVPDETPEPGVHLDNGGEWSSGPVREDG